MTKAKLTNEVRVLLAAGVNGERNCKAHGREIEAAVRRLQFHGASTTEFRGLSETGLTAEEFATMLAFELPFVFGCEVCEWLDA